MEQETWYRHQNKWGSSFLQIDISLIFHGVYSFSLPFPVIGKELKMKSVWTTMWGQYSGDGVHHPVHRHRLRAVFFLACAQAQNPSSRFCFHRGEQFSLIHSAFYFLGTSTVNPRWAQPSQLTLRDWGEACSSKQQTNWKNWPWTA